MKYFIVGLGSVVLLNIVIIVLMLTVSGWFGLLYILLYPYAFWSARWAAREGKSW